MLEHYLSALARPSNRSQPIAVERLGFHSRLGCKIYKAYA